jgi:urease accessory protein
MGDNGAPDRDPHALLRLCHLVSPALPVGAYAYSQGLEYAVHAGWVHDEATALDWLQGMASAFGRHARPADPAATASRLEREAMRRDVRHWNAQLIAARETC